MNEAVEALVAIIDVQKKQVGTSYQDAVAHWSDYKTFWATGEALWKVLAPMQNRPFVPLAEIDVGEAVYKMAVDKAYGKEVAVTPPPLSPASHFEKYIENLKRKHNTDVGLEDAGHTKEDVEKIWNSILNPPSLNRGEVCSLDDEDSPAVDLDEERRKRGKVFGLVVGRVQSGKTRNYIGLILKAFDEGWNFVIVITSDRNTLADQTIKRIVDECNNVDAIVHTMDFGNSGQVRSTRFNGREKFVGIAQKNVTHLGNMAEWIDRLSMEERENIKLLVLDDESDNATPDTHQSSSYFLADADVENVAENFPVQDDDVVACEHVRKWIRGLRGLDVAKQAVEIGMASDEPSANAVVDDARQKVSNATTQKAVMDLLLSRENVVARLLGINVEVDVGCGQLRWLNNIIVEKMDNKRGRGHLCDNAKVLQSLVQYVFETRVSRSRINHLLATIFSNGGDCDAGDKYRFGRMAYVCYTATPYANMLNENPKLDPMASDFMYPMQVSRHYIGMARIFGEPKSRHDKSVNMRIVHELDDSEMSIVHAIQDGADNLSVTDDLIVSWNDELDPEKPDESRSHEAEWMSLKKALAWLFCCAAARRFRRMRNKPDSRQTEDRWTTMLLNIGTDQGLHSDLKEIIGKHLSWLRSGHLDDFREACHRVWCGVDGNGNPMLHEKFGPEDFRRACGDYGEVEEVPTWEEVEEHLVWFLTHMDGNVHCNVANATSEGKVGMGDYRDVDGRYSHDSDDHIWILCGGYIMSRGLTLDGLVVSYVDRMRKSTAVDTLVQIGRWFGYREGYELLPRVWLSGESIEEFKKITFTENRLHHELKHNFDMGFSPKDESHYTRIIKWRRKPSGRSAAETPLGDVSGAFDIFSVFWPDSRCDIIDGVRTFVERLGMGNQMQRPLADYRAQGLTNNRYHTYPYWRNVDPLDIASFLSEHARNSPSGVRVAIRALLKEMQSVPQKWDVVFSNALPKGRGREEEFQVAEGMGLKMSNTPCTGVVNGCFEFRQFSGDNLAFFSGVKTSAIVQGEIDLIRNAMSDGAEPPEGWDADRIEALFAQSEANGFREPLPGEIRRALLGTRIRMTSTEYRKAVFGNVEKPDPFYNGANPILQIALVRPPDGKGLMDVETPFVAVSFYWPNHDDSHYSYVAAGAVEDSMDENDSAPIDKIRIEIDRWLRAYGFLTKGTLRRIITERFGDLVDENGEKLNVALNDGRTRYAAVNPNLDDVIERHINKSTLYSMHWLSETSELGVSVGKCVCRHLEAEACEAIDGNGGFVECNSAFRNLMRCYYPYHLKCVHGDLDNLFLDMEACRCLSCFYIWTNDVDGK